MNIEEKIKEDQPLAPYCTFQIGGLADTFLEAKSTEDVLAGIEWAEERDMPIFVFSGGSNLLFDDAGFRGLVIRVKSCGLKMERRFTRTVA
jgi:UDP-N-acetylmuramate dehydrogenase